MISRMILAQGLRDRLVFLELLVLGRSRRAP
jgi:hypothetical protein